MSTVYNNPKYYEISFSFRNTADEVDAFEECFRRFSQIPVKSVLELGSGNSPHMENLIKRGYQYNGLDISEAMLEYSQQKASRLNTQVNLVHANMVDFSLETKVDFVFVLLGSLFVKSSSELITHFDSVAQVLKTGGLYLLEEGVEWKPVVDGTGTPWEIEREGIKVKNRSSLKTVSHVEQTYEQTIILEVNDKGEQLTLVEKSIRKAIYPQEFLSFISGRKDFEFVGWWNEWQFDQPLPSEQADGVEHPMILVRRI